MAFGRHVIGCMWYDSGFEETNLIGCFYDFNEQLTKTIIRIFRPHPRVSAKTNILSHQIPL